MLATGRGMFAPYAEPVAINNRGQVVGFNASEHPLEYQPSLWENGRTSVLPSGSFEARASAVNGRGQIVGATGDNLWFNEGEATLWENGRRTSKACRAGVIQSAGLCAGPSSMLASRASTQATSESCRSTHSSRLISPRAKARSSLVSATFNSFTNAVSIPRTARGAARAQFSEEVGRRSSGVSERSSPPLEDKRDGATRIVTRQSRCNIGDFPRTRARLGYLS